MNIESLLKALGRCVYYHSGLAKHFGGVNPALFFSQIHYWQGKTDNPLGVYKSAEVLREETGMTYREQATARAQLVKLGVLIETHKRLEHRLYFRIDYEVLQSILANGENVNHRNAENANGEDAEAQVVNSNKEMTSEMKDIRAAEPRSRSGLKVLKTYIEECKANGVKPIPDDHHSREFARDAGIEPDMLAMCWFRFLEDHTTGARSAKRYKDWGQAFGNAVKANWYKFWFMSDDGVQWTSQGRMYKTAYDAKHGD